MRYFSLFTGIGGLDVGLEEVGAKCVGFSETKKSSSEIYQRHYPAHENFGDVTKIDPYDMPDFDVLTGGFPCQSFSIAGLRRGFEDHKDKKGAMVLYIHRILVAKQPKFFALENVKGILNHGGGATFRKVFRLFENAGYNVRCVLLNALYYGSAQNRERVIFLGSKTEVTNPRPRIVDGTKRFRDFRDGDEKNFVWLRQTAKNRMRDKIEQRDPYSYSIVGGYDRMGTLMTGISGGGGRNPSSQQKIVQEADGRWRFLTALEGERLQGFPDGWTAGQSNGARWFALGNAVHCDVSRYLFKEYAGQAFGTEWGKLLAQKNG